LDKFVTEFSASAPRLVALVRQTVEIFDKLNKRGVPVETLNDLAWHVHQGKLGDNGTPSDRVKKYRLVEDAKLSVAALFLSKEPEAIRRGLPGYRTLMRWIFPSTLGTDYRSAVRNSSFRVLTFNYDRLFELAFRQHFEVDLQEAFYGPTVLKLWPSTNDASNGRDRSKSLFVFEAARFRKPLQF
jgi:hypothetical protein